MTSPSLSEEAQAMPLHPSDDAAENLTALPGAEETNEEDLLSPRPGELDTPLEYGTLAFSACASLNSWGLGYILGVSPGVVALIQEEHGMTETQRDIFVDSIHFFAIMGAMVSWIIAEQAGRRWNFLWANVWIIVGLGVTVTSDNFYVLMLGRLITGVGYGLGLAVAPLYIAEIAPAPHRGQLVALSEIGRACGILHGYINGILLDTVPPRLEWRIALLFGCLVPAVTIYLTFTVLPESPRWLAIHGKESDAREVFERIYPHTRSTSRRSQHIIDVLMGAFKVSERNVTRVVGKHALCCQLCGLCGGVPSLQRMVTVAAVAALAHQAVGADALQEGIIELLDQSGLTSESHRILILVILGAVTLVCMVATAKVVDRWGRRPLLIVSLLGCAATVFLLSFSFLLDEQPGITSRVVILAFHFAAFGLGLGPTAWVVISEIFPTQVRARALSLAAVLNQIMALVASLYFPTLADLVGWAGLYYILSMLSVAFLILVSTYVPETKGKPLEEMSVFFAEICGDTALLDRDLELILRRRAPDGVMTSDSPTPEETSTWDSGDVI